MGIKLFKTYRKVRHIFVRPSLRFFFGKWRNDPNLPVWRRGNTIHFGKYNERNDTYDCAKLVKSEWTEAGKKNHPILSKIFKPTYVLPMWLSFYKFNHGMMWKTKWGEYRYEFPPQFTLVFFGLSLSITAHAPKTDKENATFIYDDLYWEAILNAVYAPKGVDNLEHAILEGGEYVWRTYSYWSVRPSFIRKSYKSKYDLIMNKIKEERTIKIKNRYNDTIVLRNIEDCKYILENTDYYRVIYDPETDEIKAVDPSGGPFLTVGFKIPNTNKEIVNIEGKSKDKPIFIII